MKRKKWSEVEEQTLLSKYAELLNCGALLKLKTREKKFKPIADHVNAVHHLQDPVLFPFKWSWRDVSIKVQNMRHQYLGVKQKIRTPNNEFNWKDGENHWENFMKYKEVFGDVELELKDCNFNCSKKFGDDPFADGGMLGLGEEAELGNGERVGDSGCGEGKKLKKGISQKRFRMKELETRLRLERELAEERQRRIKLEEKWEEEEMEWRERLVSMQLEHEKQMMQMHADACQNQMQILGVMTRLMCQFFGVANDGLGSGLGTLPHQVLQNLQHPGGLEDNGKPDAASPSEFCRLSEYLIFAQAEEDVRIKLDAFLGNRYCAQHQEATVSLSRFRWKYFNMDLEVEMWVLLDFPTAQGIDTNHFREHNQEQSRSEGMGNAIGGRKKAKVMKIDGETLKLKTPVSAFDVVKDYPGHVLLDSETVKRFGVRATPLEAEQELKPKKVYFLVELPKFPRGERVPRRMRSAGVHHMSATDRLEALMKMRRSSSDVSASVRREWGPVQIKLRLPRAQVEKVIVESRDEGEAAEKIINLCIRDVDKGR
nr:stress response protein NST1-like [Ipomoea batatas]